MDNNGKVTELRLEYNSDINVIKRIPKSVKILQISELYATFNEYMLLTKEMVDELNKLYKLTNLNNLILYNTEINEEIGLSNLKNLEKIQLDDCLFDLIPKSIFNLENLKILRFSYSSNSKGIPFPDEVKNYIYKSI